MLYQLSYEATDVGSRSIYSSTYRPTGLLYTNILKTMVSRARKNVYIKDHPCFYPQKKALKIYIYIYICLLPFISFLLGVYLNISVTCYAKRRNNLYSHLLTCKTHGIHCTRTENRQSCTDHQILSKYVQVEEP